MGYIINNIQNLGNSIRSKKFLIVVIIAIIILFICTVIITSENVYIPQHQEVVTWNQNPDIYVVIKKQDHILIPVSTYLHDIFNPDKTKTNLYVDIYFKNQNLTRDNFKDVLLSGQSSSILSQTESTFTGNQNYAKYDITLGIGHTLRTGNFTEPYIISIIDDSNKLSNTIPNIKELEIPITYRVQTLDFNGIEYFWIISLGVVASRILNLDDLKKPKLNLSLGDLAWIPFSAIITIMIYSSFVSDVKLTNDIIVNLALAFAFGLGFDKILETWKKAPNNRITP